MACLLLTGCGHLPEQINETAIAAITNTPSATPPPNLTATNQAIRAATQTMQVFNARVKLTEFAKPTTTTTIAKAGLMPEEIQTVVFCF